MSDAPPAFDAAKYKSTTRDQWDAAAEAWHRWGELLGSWLGPATETMFDMADVGPGSRVLDVAAGAGEQSMAAARRVGPDGHVLATDLSAGFSSSPRRWRRSMGTVRSPRRSSMGKRCRPSRPGASTRWSPASA